MPKVIPTLERSLDPLSDTTPTYEDITDDLIEATWFGGKKEELDDPQAGGATFVLKNRSRRYEPDFPGSNVDILQRFRLTISDGVTSSQEGIFFATDYELRYPANTEYSEVVVTCADGFEILSLDALPALDPPEATSYDEVVNHDQPSLYYPLNEPAGTKLVAHLRSKKWRRKHPTKKKRYWTTETASELGGVSGPSGTYKNLPVLGFDAPLVTGEADTCVEFESGRSTYARVPLDESDLIDTNRLSISAWVLPQTTQNQTVVAGPLDAGIGRSVFRLGLTSGNNLTFTIETTTGGPFTWTAGTVPTGAGKTHIGASWDGQHLRIYVNGAQVGGDGAVPGGLSLLAGDPGGFLYIARDAAGNYYDGLAAKVAVYETGLSSERFLAHYEAGAERGYVTEQATARVSNAGDTPLWTVSTSGGDFRVAPAMKYGQSPLEEVLEAVSAEQPYSHLFFMGDGNLKYLGWEYKATGSYMTTQATFGDTASEVPYEGIDLDYDNDFYNEVTISHLTNADGEAHHTATDATSESARGRRVYSETLSLVEHMDAEAVAHTVLDEFKDPQLRFTSLSLSGGKQAAMTQILARDIGDLIRVKRRGEGGTAIDRITHILGYSKHFDAKNRHLTCTYDLARGFNAGVSEWRLGITGFTELNTTAVLG